MNSEQRREVEALFEAALEHAEHDPAAWVRAHAIADADVREEVLSLLAYHGRAGDFLSAPAVARLPELLVEPEGLAAGAILGPYRIVREIGRGGMGHVYLAEDTRIGRHVALKSVAPEMVRDATARERLRREARAAGALSHPGICTVYALEEIEGDVFLASEFIDGATLRDELHAGSPPSASAIVDTARDIASALAAAHDRHIVHRDLKPENVMRTRDGRIKILDFGLARLEADGAADAAGFATRPGIVLGTPAYMAPEQLAGNVVDARADVFALGVLLYEYASGVHPFAAASPIATIARVLESHERPLLEQAPSVPPSLSEIIHRCLQKDPQDRFASAREVAAAIERPAGVRRPHRATWWTTHHIAFMVIYIASAARAWQVKFWLGTPLSIAIFMALVLGAALGGGLRGHLVFTQRVNRAHLADEWRRLCLPLRAIDLAMALLLIVDALLVAPWPVSGVWTMALAAALALGALVLDPATSRAVVEA